MDVRCHWLTERVHQKHFNFYWRPGIDNMGDYQSKHHSDQHRKYMRSFILHQSNILYFLWGCSRLLYPQLITRTYAQALHRTLRTT